MKPIVITEDCIIYNDMPYGWKSGKGQPKWHDSLYHRWHDMWNRCRNPRSKRYNNYKDCKIDERYRYFSNYVDDIMQLENFDKLCEEPSKWHIDKDIKNSTNRHYYFENLTIVTIEDNSEDVFKRNGNPNNKKPIKATHIKNNTVLIFESKYDAEKNKFYRDCINKCLEGKKDSYKGYRWEYLEGDDI